MRLSPQTFGGALLVAVIGGVIPLFIQKGFFETDRAGPTQPNPTRQETPQDIPNLAPSQSRVGTQSAEKDDVAARFVAPIGVDRLQVVECVRKNSNRYVVGTHYGLKETTGPFKELQVEMYRDDLSLKYLLQACVAPHVGAK